MHLFIRVCQMWSPRACARSHERTSEPLISVLLCERALTELEQSNNNKDEEERGGSIDYILNRARIVLLPVETFSKSAASTEF